MRTTKDILRFASIASLLLAGSCAAPFNDGSNQVTDPAFNHPISVEPSYHSIKLPFSATDAGLMPEDAAHFSVFVAEYLNSGNGAISITAPAGGNAAIGYFGERLASLGVPRDRILVGTKQTGDGDNRVEIGYVGYKAHVENCDDPWSKDWSDTSDNQPTANFGCSVQRNIAAMVADPRDLVQPRTMDASDAARRNTVMGHYEKGEVTQADKHTSDKGVEQSGESSSIQ
jgi:pilus assembly protein CpaD